ncbi:hypothetical protein [Cerasicoccus fimbriatus]|uniref:hypothetical protein n=1 Tax=Cerasicoccus fimbriatus TaxID=3014554 RepID=UPI0022B4B634|nr:hypothetical protein [Cerasicoccus sp. TK19100]
MSTPENLVFEVEGVTPAEVTVKPGKCELLLKHDEGSLTVTLENFVPLKRIIDIVQGFEKLTIIDQHSADNPVEEGRFLVRAHRGGEVIKGFCDGFQG